MLCFIDTASFNPHNGPPSETGSQKSLTEEEMGSERLGEMPTITQPVNG